MGEDMDFTKTDMAYAILLPNGRWFRGFGKRRRLQSSWSLAAAKLYAHTKWDLLRAKVDVTVLHREKFRRGGEPCTIMTVGTRSSLALTRQQIIRKFDPLVDDEPVTATENDYVAT